MKKYLLLCLCLIILSLSCEKKDKKILKESEAVFHSNDPDRHIKAYNLLQSIERYKYFFSIEYNSLYLKKIENLEKEIKEDYKKVKTKEFFEKYNEKTKIVYYSSGEGVCTIKLDGTDKKIIYKTDYITYPKWSPDGKYILISASEIINSDGTKNYNIFKETGGGMKSDWSPDGTKILYLDSKGSIYIYNFMTKKIRKHEGEYYDCAVWMKNSRDILCFKYNKIYLLRENQKESEDFVLQTPDNEGNILDWKSFFSDVFPKNPILSRDGDKVWFFNGKSYVIDFKNQTIKKASGGVFATLSPDSEYIIEYDTGEKIDEYLISCDTLYKSDIFFTIDLNIIGQNPSWSPWLE